MALSPRTREEPAELLDREVLMDVCDEEDDREEERPSALMQV